eukprot:1746894-Heterocapsa_arctica.AAC.1
MGRPARAARIGCWGGGVGSCQQPRQQRGASLPLGGLSAGSRKLIEPPSAGLLLLGAHRAQ